MEIAGIRGHSTLRLQTNNLTQHNAIEHNLTSLLKALVP